MSTDTLTRYRRSATEAEIEQTIKDAAVAAGGRFWHVRDSRRKDVTDMLDMLILLPPRYRQPGIVALLEAKSQKRDVTPGQEQVLDLAWSCSRVVSGVVRPEPRKGEMSIDEALRALGLETR